MAAKTLSLAFVFAWCAVILTAAKYHPIEPLKVKYQKFPGCEALIDTDHGEKEIDLRELVGLFPNGSAR